VAPGYDLHVGRQCLGVLVPSRSHSAQFFRAGIIGAYS
jgi:hypothetical protein